MTETHDFRCPNCGSPLTVAGDEREVKCSFCGSTVVVPEELRPRQQAPQVVIQTNFPVTQFPSSDYTGTKKSVKTALVIPILVAVAALIFIFAGAAAFFISQKANTASQNPGSGFVPIPTERPTPTATPIPQSTPFSKVLVKDDFSNKSSGWDQSSDSNYTLAYVSHGYRIFINEQDGGQTVWNGDNYTDVNVEVDVKQVAGPNDARVGVSCRVSSDGSFYSFEISPDGSYSIEKYTGGSAQSTSSALAEGALYSGAIDFSQANHLRGDCAGDVLTLYLNEQPLLQTTDGSLTSGATGLIARSGPSGEAGIDMLFSNFEVRGP
jgi:uncharacterized Zn finger protein (UPF0148 family)